MTGPWVSGESLSPSRLNLHAGAATLATGFSTDTIQGQSGATVNLISDASVANTLAAQREELGGAPSSLSGILSLRAHSQQSDYLFFQDAAGFKSNYLLGLKTGDSDASLVDGLNLYDKSANTMIVRFSSDSVRFYPPLVAPVFDTGGALADTYNAAIFLPGASVESKIQAAINAAKADGISRVYLPASLMSFSAASVSFETSVQMVGEGTDWTVYDLRAYGVKGNGIVDDRAAIQAAENVRPAYSTLRFASGHTYKINVGYDGSLSEKSKLLKVQLPGVWDLNGAQIQWGSATALTTGTDGAGLGMINALAAPWSLLGFGSLDGQSLVRSPLCFKDDKSGFFLLTELKNLRETSGVWDGTMCTVSIDVTGTSFTTRAKNISGIVRRPSCPMMTPGPNTIAAHTDVTAFLWGGGVTNEGNHTSHAIVLSDAKEPIVNCFLGLLGIPQFVSNNTSNVFHGDFSACDINSNALETQGFTFGGAWSSVSTLGHAIKNGAVSGWFDYNVISTDTRPPNVGIQGGGAINQGLIELRGTLQGNDGTASAPTFTFLSEKSLGLYRSTASDLNLTYGQFVFPNGTAAQPPMTFGSEHSLGWYRSGASNMNLSYGQLVFPNGSAVQPPMTFGSEHSLGWFRSGTSTMDLSYGSLNFNQARLISIRTTATSLSSTQLNVNESAFFIGGASGATLGLRVNGIVYLFNSSSTTIG